MNYKNLFIEDEDTKLEIYINKDNLLTLSLETNTSSGALIFLNKEDAIVLKKELTKLIKEL